MSIPLVGSPRITSAVVRLNHPFANSGREQDVKAVKAVKDEDVFARSPDKNVKDFFTAIWSLTLTVTFVKSNTFI